MAHTQQTYLIVVGEPKAHGYYFERSLDRRAGGSPRAPRDPETELRGGSGLLSTFAAGTPARRIGGRF